MTNKVFCRAFQNVFGLINRNLKYKKQLRLEGVDAFAKIPGLLEEQGCKRPFVVTGPRIAKSDFFQAFCKELEGRCLVYSEVKPDPPISQIEDMLVEYLKQGCDSIIAIGGGSNMDAAKAVAARVARPRKSLKRLGGVMKVMKKTPFFIAVPTTAGTGSECTVAAVVTDDRENHKYAINDPVLCPDVAVLDPNLTVSLPPALTAYTGMDAMTHAVEAYLNKKYHKPDTKEQSREAIKAIFEFLPRAYADGSDLKAREQMLLASYRAGQAFTVACVGNVHAIAHTMGGLYHVQHGLANAVVLPYVLEEYRPVIDEDLAGLADLCGIGANLSDSEKAGAFIEAIRTLNASLSIPEHIDGILEEDLPKMSAWAVKEANPLYPVPVIFQQEDFARVMRKVGRL